MLIAAHSDGRTISVWWNFHQFQIMFAVMGALC